ncbi:MAG: ERF family protein [Gammaproteobacteria bacterium]
MKNPLAKRDETAVTVGDPFVMMVERLATNKDVDPDKLQKLVDIQIQIMDRTNEAEFNAAMSRVQAKLPEVERNADNLQTKSKYAKHEAIAKAIKPIYTAEGFSAVFSQGQSDIDGYIRINGRLRHSAGHSEPHYVDLPLDKAGIKGNVNKTDLHATSSTFTYGRRILTCMMFDVATGDDTDGNLPQKTITTDQATVINDLIKETKANKKKVLGWAGGAETVEDIPASYYDEAVRLLEGRRGGS